MSIPDPSETREARARRIRAKHRIRREAERRMAGLHQTPTMREIYAPRVIFGAMILLAVIGAVLVRRTDAIARRPERRIPHLTAVKSLDALAEALGRYMLHVGRYPTAEGGLASLNKDLGEEGWDGPYLVQLFDDPWGREYFYAPPESDGSLPTLFSLGPDGVAGTRDDLRPGTNFFNAGTAWTNGWRHRWERLPDLGAAGEGDE